MGETTFSALASEKVQDSLWDEESPIPHTRLGQTADLILVCPATARLLSDYRTGRSDDFQPLMDRMREVFDLDPAADW